MGGRLSCQTCRCCPVHSEPKARPGGEAGPLGWLFLCLSNGHLWASCSEGAWQGRGMSFTLWVLMPMWPCHGHTCSYKAHLCRRAQLCGESARPSLGVGGSAQPPGQPGPAGGARGARDGDGCGLDPKGEGKIGRGEEKKEKEEGRRRRNRRRNSGGEGGRGGGARGGDASSLTWSLL